MLHSCGWLKQAVKQRQPSYSEMHKKVIQRVASRLGCKPNKSTSLLKRWVYQPNLRRCKMAFRVTFSCISLYNRGRLKGFQTAFAYHVDDVLFK